LRPYLEISGRLQQIDETFFHADLTKILQASDNLVATRISLATTIRAA
jgi:hypothetical protein